MHEKEKVASIQAYIHGLLRQENGKMLHERHREAIEAVTPEIAFRAFHGLHEQGVPVDRLLSVLEKCMNVFHEPLQARLAENESLPPFLVGLRRENEAMLEKLKDLKQAIQAQDLSRALATVDALLAYEAHWVKKENILFPYLEAVADHFQGLAIMWQLHDRVRQDLKEALASLKETTTYEPQHHRMLGKLLFSLHGLVQKENLILFPVALEKISAQDFQDMLLQSQEEAWAYVSSPAVQTHGRSSRNANQSGGGFESVTGHLTARQIEQIFSSLPVDITVIDEKDEVCYFSRPQDRIFPRSPAIIGRPVKRCHPPHSLDKVTQILEAFRSGEKSHARFWIQRQGRFILIEYFALRDESHRYCGTMEVSQDATSLRSLSGERRLVSWQDEMDG